MIRRVWFARRAECDAGYVAIVSALLLPVFLMLAAVAVDVARWYVEIEKEQKVADAASLAGVTYIPQDFDGAVATVKDIAKRNGYDPDASGSNVEIQVCALSGTYSTGGGVSAGCQSGLRPSQLKVTISNNVPNVFATIFGINTTNLARSAVADFNGPAPIGSPCNTFGNEPPSTAASGQSPLGSTLPMTTAPALCSSTPQFWGNVHGPDVAKVQGDQYMTRRCTSGESGCSGGTNDEFDPKGYFLTVRVGAGAVGQPIDLQLYDPAYVETGGKCGDNPSGTVGASSAYPLAPTDAATRYARSANAFCAGDQYYTSSTRPTVTSFGLRSPVDNANPVDAEPTSSSTGGSCAKQFQGYSDPTYTALKSDGGLARVFHQWVSLCTFTPTEAGDYYLQVRTNIQCGSVNTATGLCSNANRVYTQDGDDSGAHGDGGNRFAVRAVLPDPASRSVSVSGLTKMAIYANSTSHDAEFNLIRVTPGAIGKSLVFKFFDPGDGESNATAQILPPREATILQGASRVPYTTPTGCFGQDRAASDTEDDCEVTGIGGTATPTWQGQVGTVVLPIPEGYECQTSVTNTFGCWFRVHLHYPNGTVTDATTWTAYITGDPVRLTQ